MNCCIAVLDGASEFDVLLFACCPPPLGPVGDFSEHLDQLTSRGEGVDSPDTTTTSKTSSEQGATLGQRRSDTQDKTPGATVGKVPKSVSASALSLMIPGGERVCLFSPDWSPRRLLCLALCLREREREGQEIKGKTEIEIESKRKKEQGKE